MSDTLDATTSRTSYLSPTRSAPASELAKEVSCTATQRRRSGSDDRTASQCQRESDRYVRGCISFCINVGNFPLICPNVHGEKSVAVGATATVTSAFIAGRQLALKTYCLHADPRELSVARKRFLRETAIFRMLRHPSIIRFVGVLDDPDRLCIITTWMQNGELNAYLRAQPDAPKRPLARQVAAGLRYLRSQWIVHGDIKGANILIDGHGRAQIADFGSARVVVPFPDRRIFPPDATQSTGGTCRWMAPELLLPAQFSMHTFQSDVFSFGMVLYEIFSDGEIPFDDQPNSMAANLAIIRGNRPPRPPNTPADIWAVATACWRADPASRPAISSIII